MSKPNIAQEAKRIYDALMRAQTSDEKIELHREAVNALGRSVDCENLPPSHSSSSFGQKKRSVNRTVSSTDIAQHQWDASSTTSNESVSTHPRRKRTLSNSSAGSRRRASPNLKNQSLPTGSTERLTPDAERRVFNYQYRGPIPRAHHCQRSLFGRTDVPANELVETPKKKVTKAARVPLRSHSKEKLTASQAVAKLGRGFNLATRDASRDVNRKTHYGRSKSYEKGIERAKNLFPAVDQDDEYRLSPTQRQLDMWRPIVRKSPNPISASTPKKASVIPDHDEHGYAIPSISGSLLERGGKSEHSGELNRSRDVTPPELYKTPTVDIRQGRENRSSDSSSSGKELYFTPMASQIPQKLKQSAILKADSVSMLRQIVSDTESEALQQRCSKTLIQHQQRSPIVATETTPLCDLRHLTREYPDRNKDDVDFSKATRKLWSESNVDATPVATNQPPTKESPIKDAYSGSPSLISHSTQLLKPDSPNTKALKTSVTKERARNAFHKCVDIYLKAMTKIAEKELKYERAQGNTSRVEYINSVIQKYPSAAQKMRDGLEELLVNYDDDVAREVVCLIAKLQNKIRRKMAEAKERARTHRRQSISFSALGVIDVNKFEEDHLAVLNKRLENATRLSEAIKNIYKERNIVEENERKAIKDLLRFSVGNTATTAAISLTTSTEVTLSSSHRRIRPPTDISQVVKRTERLLEETRKPHAIHLSDQQCQTSLPSTARHNLAVDEKASVNEPVHTIDYPAAASNIRAGPSVIPKLDLGQLSVSVSLPVNEIVETPDPSPIPILEELSPSLAEAAGCHVPDTQNVEEVPLPSVPMLADQPTPSPLLADLPEPSDSARTDGRTSRDASSLGELEPAPAMVEVVAIDEAQRTENDVSTLVEMEEPVSTHSTSFSHPILSVADDVHHDKLSLLDSEFSNMPSQDDDLKSLPSLPSAKDAEKPQSSLERTSQNPDSDPERIPSTGTDSVKAQKGLLLNKLPDDNFVPSPPMVNTDEPVPTAAETVTDTVEEVWHSADEQENKEQGNNKLLSETESGQVHSVASVDTESSKVKVPSSLISTDEENKMACAGGDIRSESSTTTTVTSSQQTTSVSSSDTEKTTSSSLPSAKGGSKSSTTNSIPEEIPSTGRSRVSTSSGPNSLANAKFVSSPRADDDFSASITIDEPKDEEFNNNPAMLEQHPVRSTGRRRSWDRIETGIIGRKQGSPTYISAEHLDNDLPFSTVNEPPRFRGPVTPLSPYAAVSPRSPRSPAASDHGKRSNARSPTANKSFTFSNSAGSIKSDTSVLPTSPSAVDDGNYLEMSLKDIAPASMFDMSGGSDRLSFGSNIDKEKDASEWSPGFSRELLVTPPKPRTAVDTPVPIASQLTERSESTATASVIDEDVVEMTEAQAKPILKDYCQRLWRTVQERIRGTLTDSFRLDVKADNFNRSHFAFRRFLADLVCLYAERLVDSGFKFASLDDFTEAVCTRALQTLSLESRNDLLHERRTWFRKNPPDFKLKDAVNWNAIHTTCREREFAVADIAYREAVAFLEKHAPTELEDLLKKKDH